MDIEKLKALALAAHNSPLQHLSPGAPGDVLRFAIHVTPATVLELCNENTELLAEVERLRARFEYIEDHATTSGGGNGFTVSFFVPVDHEDIGCGIDAAIEKEAPDFSHVIPPTRGTGSQQEITRLDIMGMIRMQCHRCYASAIDREDIDAKYMAEIEEALRAVYADAEVARRGRAQGGNTSDKSSELIGSAPAAGTQKDALLLAKEAMEAAQRNHGLMLYSDPLQEAWKYHGVDNQLSAALKAIDAAIGRTKAGKEPGQ